MFSFDFVFHTHPATRLQLLLIVDRGEAYCHAGNCFICPMFWVLFLFSFCPSFAVFVFPRFLALLDFDSFLSLLWHQHRCFHCDHGEAQIKHLVVITGYFKLLTISLPWKSSMPPLYSIPLMPQFPITHHIPKHNLDIIASNTHSF